MALFRSKKNKHQRYQDYKRKMRARQAQRMKSLRDKIYYAYLLVYLGHYKKYLAGIVALVLVNSIVGLVLPYSARIVLDYVVPKRDFSLLNIVILAGFCIYVLNAALRYLEQKLVVTFSMNLITEVRQDLFKHQLNLPLSYFEKASPGKLISKLTYSVYMLKLMVETVAYVCFRETVMILVLLVAAAVIDLRLTLVFLCLTPLLALYVSRLNRFMGKIAVHLQTKNDEILKVLDRAFHSIKLFQVFGGGAKEGKRFEEVLEQDKQLRIRRTLVYALNSIVITLLASCVVLAALWYGGRQIIRGNLTYGDILAYMIVLGMLFRPISQFARASAFYQAGKIGIRTIFAVFENTSPIEEPANPVTPKKREGALQFRHVWFRHGKGRGGLQNVSFRIEPGQKVLVVGKSGAGKSTLFNLMLRLYEPERGTIEIDGVNIRRMKLEDLRNYFSVVTQDQLHVEDTILNNIFLDNSTKGSHEIEQQLERALEMGRQMEMNRFVTGLQKRYGQKIDSAGLGFSRGELQKLAIMRAATKEAPIILMDEPTASLDHHSEKEVIRIIDEQFKDKTLMIVSHRPLPQFRPDWIMVLRNGRLVAQGNHFYLRDHSKFYRQLLGGSDRGLRGIA